jgi:hypothetical protein
MAKQLSQVRELVGFDEETWHALNLLSRESSRPFRGPRKKSRQAGRDEFDKGAINTGA